VPEFPAKIGSLLYQLPTLAKTTGAENSWFWWGCKPYIRLSMKSCGTFCYRLFEIKNSCKGQAVLPISNARSQEYLLYVLILLDSEEYNQCYVLRSLSDLGILC